MQLMFVIDITPVTNANSIAEDVILAAFIQKITAPAHKDWFVNMPTMLQTQSSW